MAIYHLSTKIIGRKAGKNYSAIQASEYRQREGKFSDKKEELIFSGVLLPEHADPRFRDWKTYWSEIDKAEKRKDSQLAREVRVALPKELTIDQQKQLLAGFCQHNFVNQGMLAHVVVHDQKAGNGNIHAHIMLSTREFKPDGQIGKKNRDWNKKDALRSWRSNWSVFANEALKRAGKKERIDHRTLKEQGLKPAKTVHLGKFLSIIDEINKGKRKFQFHSQRVIDQLKKYREYMKIKKENDRIRKKRITPNPPKNPSKKGMRM